MHKISNLKPRLKSLIHILYRFFFLDLQTVLHFFKTWSADETIWKLVKVQVKRTIFPFPVLDLLFPQRDWNWFFTDWLFISPHFLTQQLDKDCALQPPDVLMDFMFKGPSGRCYLSRPHDVLHPYFQKRKEKKDFLFFLTLFTTALHLPLHCKNGLGCKWLVHVKVFFYTHSRF